MEALLAVALVLTALWWIQRRIADLSKLLHPSYVCRFTRELQVPKDVSFSEKYRMMQIFGITTEQVVILPFPPQQGMSISEGIRFGNNEDDMVSFRSGAIEEIVWHNWGKQFDCKVAPVRINDEKELGLALAYSIAHGWKVPHGMELRLVEDTLKGMEAEIVTKEQEIGKELKPDRDLLSTIRRRIAWQPPPSARRSSRVG